MSVDDESIKWLIRLQEHALEGPIPAQVKEEFRQWAGQSVPNLRACLEMITVFQALGECEAELIGQLVVQVDDQGNIVKLP